MNFQVGKVFPTSTIIANQKPKAVKAIDVKRNAKKEEKACLSLIFIGKKQKRNERNS